MHRLSLRKCLLLVYMILHNGSVTRYSVGGADTQFPCGQYRCGGDRLKQPCGCDVLCEVYGDCCPDYTGVTHQGGNGELGRNHGHQGENEQLNRKHGHTDDNAQSDKNHGHWGENEQSDRNLGYSGQSDNNHEQPDYGQSDDNHGHQVGTSTTGKLKSLSDASNTQEVSTNVRSRDNNTSSISPRVNEPITPFITCVDTRLGSAYFLVSKCPSDWTDDYVTKSCESHWYGVSQVYILPVTSAMSSFSYKNIFCAYCNGQKLRDVKFWQFSVPHICGEGLSFTEIIVNYVRDPVTCGIKFNEPPRRECLRNTKDCTSVGSSNQNNQPMVKWKCDKYVDYVRIYGTFYKNAYCVLCEETNPRKEPSCDVSWTDMKDKENRDIHKTSSLSSLAHFRDAKNDDRISHPYLEKEVDCDEGGVFYKHACLPLHCPRGYVYDKESQDCEENPNALYYVSVCYDKLSALPSNYRQYMDYNRETPMAECDGYTHKGEYLLFNLQDTNVSTILSLFDTNDYKKLILSEKMLYTNSTVNPVRCETYSRTGAMDGNLVEILAFLEKLDRNDAFPWTANISVTRDTIDDTFRVTSTICTIPRVCLTIRSDDLIPLGHLIVNDTFTHSTVTSSHAQTYVCRDIVVSRIRVERRKRNQKLLEFLEVLTDGKVSNEGSVKMAGVFLLLISSFVFKTLA